MKIENKLILSYFILGMILAIAVLFCFLIGLRLGMLIIVIPVLTFVIGHFFAKFFLREVESLNKSIRIVSEGNLDYKSDTHTNTDIGEISRDLDKIVEDLNRSKVEISVLTKNSTAQQETIKHLENQEDHFRRLFEQSNDAVFVYDFDGNMIDINEKACKMLGYDKKKLMNIKFLDLYTEEELTASKEAFKNGAETCSVRLESVFKRADGDKIDVDISTSVVDMKHGIMQSIVSDITTRKMLQNALRESEEKFRTFMETANDLMYITDVKGNFVYTNNAMSGLLGYEPKELLKMSLKDITHEEHMDNFEKEHNELMKKGEIISDPIWRTKDGNKIYGELEAVTVYTADGLLKGTSGVFRDISERKKIEQSQRLAQLGELAADVAHEVNNPITVITGHAELILMKEGKVEKEKILKNMKVIVDQCEAAQNIIKRLLMFSKPSKGEFTEQDLNEAVKEVTKLVAHKFMSDKVKIELELSEDIPHVKMDGKQIQEVLMNLLKNADEAMTEEGGTITLKTSCDSREVKVMVQDTGSGISEEAMNKIFDPFFTTKDNGTGLGLSVCYGILKAHGGDLRYDSIPGKGTTATLVFPRQ